MSTLIELLSRYSGKKILSLAVGVGSILYLTQQYWAVAEVPLNRAMVTMAACIGIGLSVAGFAIGQGIGDAGERRPVPKE